MRPGMTGITLCCISRGNRPGKSRGRYVCAPHPTGRRAVYGVWCVFVFVGRHGIETVPGAKLLLNLSGLASQFICQFSVYSPTRGTCHMPPNQTI